MGSSGCYAAVVEVEYADVGVGDQAAGEGGYGFFGEG